MKKKKKKKTIHTFSSEKIELFKFAREFIQYMEEVYNAIFHFFPLLSMLWVPIYWSIRAENALTAVALYCELVYTFNALREKRKPHCISVIATGSENGKELPVGAITLRALKMTGYTLNIRSHLSYQPDILTRATIQKRERDGERKEKKTTYISKKTIAARNGFK